MLNIRISTNFDSPYKSSSIIEYWRKWHTTLSYFLRSYLFMPLVGYTLSGTKQAAGLIITMLLGGLWHGANWTFMCWGGLHGLFICTNHIWRTKRIKLNRRFCVALTFVCVSISYVFFRVDSLTSAAEMLEAMFGLRGFAVPSNLASVFKLLPLPVSADESHLVGGVGTILLLAALFPLVAWLPSTDELLQRFTPSKRWLVTLSVLLSASLLSLNRVSSFIYYQF